MTISFYLSNFAITPNWWYIFSDDYNVLLLYGTCQLYSHRQCASLHFRQLNGYPNAVKWISDNGYGFKATLISYKTATILPKKETKHNTMSILS